MISIVLRYKLRVVASVTVFFVVFALTVGLLIGMPNGGEVALIIGAGTGFLFAAFEEFYFQGRPGAWMRKMRPVLAVPIYALIVCVFFILVQHIAHLVTGRLQQLPEAYARYPVTIPAVFVALTIGILTLRIIGFIGARNLLNLLLGRYLRPIIERKMLLFLDMKDSTATVEALGAVQAKEYIGKFMFDISRPVTEYGGDIYLYTGDGLIAMWDWDDAVAGNRIVDAVDAIFSAIERERKSYEHSFGRVPEFRIGVHGGEVVISEQGDTKRAIGVYGDTINIAARMEQTAKEVDAECVFSADVVISLSEGITGFEPKGEVSVKGISKPIAIRSYNPQL